MRKIPVVYYLCRNRHLEHPHFIEVPLSCPHGLYLKDVMHRLNVLRGKGMPAMYSWSCKRSYKNGFVWHDLSEDDLIFPTNGNEFVLKGSELSIHSSLEKEHHCGQMGKLQNSNFCHSETPNSSRANETSSASSSATFKDSKTPSPPSPRRLPGEEQCPLVHQSRAAPSSINSSMADYRMHKPNGAADASTQTDDGGRKNTCIRGVSTDDNSTDFDYEKGRSNPATGLKDDTELCSDEISPPQTSSSASSSGRKMETLETLIKADASKTNRFTQEEIMPTGPRLKATNMLMQLITCGFISTKDRHSSELDYLCDNPRFIGLRTEDKECFSGSFLETRKHNEAIREGLPTLIRSSSFNADRRETESNGKIDMRSQFSVCPIDGSKGITDGDSAKEKTIKIEES